MRISDWSSDVCSSDLAMLERFGVNIRDAGTYRTNNLAAVMVTATLPAFARQGSRIDISVSTMGDAKSLQGGTLLVPPLLGADGAVYGVGQGAVAIRSEPRSVGKERVSQWKSRWWPYNSKK